MLLRFHQRFLLPAISTLFFLSAALGLWLDTQNPILKVLTSPLLLEFVLGCFLARLADTRNIPSWICYVMIACGLTALWFSQNLEHNVELRIAAWGIPAFFLTAGCVFLEKNGNGRFSKRPILTALGNSSYSTYLIHTFIILCVGTMLKRNGVLQVVPNDLLAVSSVVACLMAGYLSSIYLERNFSRILLKFLQKRRLISC